MNSPSYKGTYLGDPNLYGLELLKAARPGTADPSLDIQLRGVRNGGFTQGARLKPLFWTDPYLITGTSDADVRVKMNRVAKIINPTAAAGILVYDEDIGHGAAIDKEILARVNGSWQKFWQNDREARFNVNWIAEDGVWLLRESATETPTLDANPKTFDVPVSGVVGGNTPVRPVFTFENVTGGNVTSVTLVNNTRGETIRWTGVLADTHFLRFDSAREMVERSSDGVTYTTAMSGLTPGDPFPLLTDGVANSFTATGFGGTFANLTVTFTPEIL